MLTHDRQWLTTEVTKRDAPGSKNKALLTTPGNYPIEVSGTFDQGSRTKYKGSRAPNNSQESTKTLCKFRRSQGPLTETVLAS